MPPAGDPLAEPRPWVRRLLSALVVFHLVSMAASLGKGTAVGAAVRTVTAPLEQALGIWQAWGMFGPNPPMNTSWVRVVGQTEDGRPVDVPPLVGELPTTGIRGLYERPVKLERSMLDTTKVRLRESFALWRCRQLHEDGVSIHHITMSKEQFRTLRPRVRREHPSTPRAVKVVAFETVDCPKMTP